MDESKDPYKTLSGTLPGSGETGEPRNRFRAWQIFLILLAPGLLSLLILAVAPRDNYVENGLLMLIFGCPTAGIVCGWLFAIRLGHLEKLNRIATGFVMAIVFTVASVALAFGGCAVMAQFIRL